MTQLGSLLKNDLVCCGYDAINKKSLIEKISGLFSAYTTTPTEQIFDAFLEREQLGSTAIGHGVAIPHIRTTLFIKPQLAILTLNNPIDYDAADQRPVDIIFALIAVENSNNEHLSLLAECSGLLSQAEVRAQLRHAQTNLELMELLQSMMYSIEHH